MKKLLVLISITTIFFFACNLSKMFEQPTTEVLGISLDELPKDSVHLTVDVKVTDNDKRDAHVGDVTYQVDIEGFLSGTEKAIIDQDITPETPLELKLPLTLATDDAIKLLTMLNSGQSLSFHVTGTFHVDDKHYKNLDLPLDVQGTTDIKVGYDDFFKQPDVVVDSVSGTYTIHMSGLVPTGYTFNLNAHCTITNKDARKAEIDEIEYTPTIEGKTTEKKYYSDAYSSNLIIKGNETINLDLPVTLELNNTEGANMLNKLTDGTAEYKIEGTFHTIKVNDQTNEFNLPLYEEGTVPVTSITMAK